jgi:hypothetical protein
VRRALGTTSPQVGSLFETADDARVEAEEQAWASVPAYPNSRPPPELQRRDAMADAMADPLTRCAKQ